MGILHNILCKLKNLIKYIRSGGVVYVNIAQIHYGGLLDNKRILVTGGSSGIGYAIADKFLKEGAAVVITGRSLEKLVIAKKRLNNEKLFIVEWDVSNLENLEAKIGEAINILGGLDIVVNNAGVYSPQLFLEFRENDWDYIVDTNMKGLFFICQTIVKYFKAANRAGKIINIASNRGIMGDYGPYGVSKWGVVGLTKGLGRDLIKDGIIVNAIAPGITATNINGIDIKENAFTGGARDNRVALPEEIAETAAFLASDAANHIVGQTIIIDGGESLI